MERTDTQFHALVLKDNLGLSTRLCVDVPQFCSAIQTNLKGSSMDN